MLECLELSIISPKQGDQAMLQFNTFVEYDFKKKQAEFHTFDKKVRLDHFWFSNLEIGKYEDFSFILKIVLYLSHVEPK